MSSLLGDLGHDLDRLSWAGAQAASADPALQSRRAALRPLEAKSPALAKTGALVDGLDGSDGGSFLQLASAAAQLRIGELRTAEPGAFVELDRRPPAPQPSPAILFEALDQIEPKGEGRSPFDVDARWRLLFHERGLHRAPQLLPAMARASNDHRALNPKLVHDLLPAIAPLLERKLLECIALKTWVHEELFELVLEHRPERREALALIAYRAGVHPARALQTLERLGHQGFQELVVDALSRHADNSEVRRVIAPYARGDLLAEFFAKDRTGEGIDEYGRALLGIDDGRPLREQTWRPLGPGGAERIAELWPYFGKRPTSGDPYAGPLLAYALRHDVPGALEHVESMIFSDMVGVLDRTVIPAFAEKRGPAGRETYLHALLSKVGRTWSARQAYIAIATQCPDLLPKLNREILERKEVDGGMHPISLSTVARFATGEQLEQLLERIGWKALDYGFMLEFLAMEHIDEFEPSLAPEKKARFGEVLRLLRAQAERDPKEAPFDRYVLELGIRSEVPEALDYALWLFRSGITTDLNWYLAALGDPKVDDDIITRGDGHAAKRIFERIGEDAVLARFHEGTSMRDPALRAALGWEGLTSRRWIPLALKMLEHDVASGCSVLGKLRASVATDRLLELARTNREARTTVESALGRIGNAKANAYLLDRLEKETEPLDFLWLVRSLTTVGDPLVLAKLEARVKPWPKHVRDGVAEHLDKLRIAPAEPPPPEDEPIPPLPPAPEGAAEAMPPEPWNKDQLLYFAPRAKGELLVRAASQADAFEYFGPQYFAALFGRDQGFGEEFARPLPPDLLARFLEIFPVLSQLPVGPAELSFHSDLLRGAVQNPVPGGLEHVLAQFDSGNANAVRWAAAALSESPDAALRERVIERAMSVGDCVEAGARALFVHGEVVAFERLQPQLSPWLGTTKRKKSDAPHPVLEALLKTQPLTDPRWAPAALAMLEKAPDAAGRALALLPDPASFETLASFVASKPSKAQDLFWPCKAVRCTGGERGFEFLVAQLQETAANSYKWWSVTHALSGYDDRRLIPLFEAACAKSKAFAVENHLTGLLKKLNPRLQG